MRSILGAGILMLPLLAASQAFAESHRHSAQRAAFIKMHPCPATEHSRGKCPGYVVDHVKPLCAGGSDHPSNMQWQPIAAAKAKDREEKVLCRRLQKGT